MNFKNFFSVIIIYAIFQSDGFAQSNVSVDYNKLDAYALQDQGIEYLS